MANGLRIHDEVIGFLQIRKSTMTLLVGNANDNSGVWVEVGEVVAKECKGNAKECKGKMGGSYWLEMQRKDDMSYLKNNIICGWKLERSLRMYRSKRTVVQLLEQLVNASLNMCRSKRLDVRLNRSRYV